MKGEDEEMDNNKDLKELMKGIGGICEIAGLLRDELIRCGFTRKEAIYIVSSYTSKLLLPPANRSEGD